MESERIIVGAIKRKFLDLNILPDKSDILGDLEKYRQMPDDILKTIWDINKSTIDWDKCERIMLEEIEISHNIGIGISDLNLKYDREWYTKFLGENKTNFYTDRFYSKYANSLPPKVLYTLRQDQEQIVNLCGSPIREEEKDIRGLVFGFVQSGKTLSYTSVANAAMDAGYNMIVILAGATNILRKQTQERVNNDVIGWNGTADVGVGQIDNNMSLRPTSLTTAEMDFDKKIAKQNMGGYTLKTVSVPVVAVIKKNVNALNNINAWLSSQTKSGQINKSILLIDDESDYASVNTKDVDDPTAINKGIRKMLNHFEVSTYLAITATPFANVLINVDNNHEDIGTDLFPKSFIWTLDKPSTYLGVKEIVIDRFQNILNPNDANNDTVVNEFLKAKKTYSITELPRFIERAVAHFIFNSAKLRCNLSFKSDLSMMINVSRYTNHHQDISGLIYARISKTRSEIRNTNIQNSTDEILKLIYNLYQDDTFNINISKFNEIIEDQICHTEVIDVHSLSKKEISFTGTGEINHIVVGGLSLSRGFTIEGLITSVFLRNTQTYDALMQMGRWFGHKQLFQEYIELFTTPTIQRRFEVIEDATLDLITQLKTMRDRNETPKEFGLSIKLDPQVAMQVVAYNKARDADKIFVSMSIEGKSCETTKLWNDPNVHYENTKLVVRLIDQIFSHGAKYNGSQGLYIQAGRDQYAYQNIPIEHLISFIEKFDIPHKSLSQVSSKMPYFFLLEHLKKHPKYFDFILIEGNGPVLTFNEKTKSVKKNYRQCTISDDGYIKIDHNQLSSGGEDESAFLPLKKSNREEARADRKTLYGDKPLLMFYPIEARNSELETLGEFWAWGISIPGDQTKKELELKFANSVLIKALDEDSDEFIEDLLIEE